MRLTMTVRDWLLIDATMDNVRWEANQQGRTQDAAAANAVRRAGWNQVATHRPANGGWPPTDSTTQVELSAKQWRLAAEGIEYWASIEDEDQTESSRISLTVADAIRSALSGRPAEL